MPYYNFDDFRKACGEDPKNVIPINSVRQDANQYFRLATKEELLGFIHNNGLESLKFVNQAPWRNNTDNTLEIIVDAYEFRTLNKLGYLAFMYNSKTAKWIIKSFHLSENQNDTMQFAFKKARLLKQEGK